jgi:uncharacterized protein YndB with AHSA1/START domain
VKTVVSGGLVLKEIPIRVTPSKVFGSLTKPSMLNRWFTEEAKVDLRVGGRYTNADHDQGKFLEIIPNRRLRFTWDNPDHAAGSLVEILLTPRSKETLVTLTHSGFRKKSDLEHYGSNTSGWDWALENLRSHLEGRSTVQYEKWLETHEND